MNKKPEIHKPNCRLDDTRQNSIGVPEARASETNVFRYASGYKRETRGYACKTTYIVGAKKEILKLQITTKLIEENTNLSTFGKAIDRFVDRIKGVEKTTEQTLTTNIPDKVYLRALPLRNLDDVDTIKQEVKSGNILILRVSPVAKRSIEDINDY